MSPTYTAIITDDRFGADQHPVVPQRRVPVAPDDEVIEDGDAEQPPRLDEAPRQVDILGRSDRQAARRS